MIHVVRFTGNDAGGDDADPNPEPCYLEELRDDSDGRRPMWTSDASEAVHFPSERSARGWIESRFLGWAEPVPLPA